MKGPKKPIDYHNWGSEKMLKRFVLGLLLHFAVIPTQAQWQPGGIPIHNHTGPNDGGQLSNLNVLGYVKTPEIIADTVTFSSSTFDNITVLDNASVGGNLNSGNLTASSATISGNASVGGNLSSPNLSIGINSYLDGSNIHAGSDFVNPNNWSTDNANFRFAQNRTGGLLDINEMPGAWAFEAAISTNGPVTAGIYSNGNGYFSGNVGIGNTSPNAPLEISGINSSGVGLQVDSTVSISTIAVSIIGSQQILNLVTGSGAGGNGPGLEFFDAGNQIAAQINTSKAGTNDSNLVFQTANSGTMSEKMRILDNGNVGIGTASPQYQLDVSSYARVQGTLEVGVTYSSTSISNAVVGNVYNLACPSNLELIGGGCYASTGLVSNLQLDGPCTLENSNLPNNWCCSINTNSATLNISAICARLGPN